MAAAELIADFEGKEDILAFAFAKVLDELDRAVATVFKTEGSSAQRLRYLVEQGAVDGTLRTSGHPRPLATAMPGAVNTLGLTALAMGSSRQADHVAYELVRFVFNGVRA